MPATIIHRRAADFRPMPWKNGGGSTTELAIHPPEAGLAQGFVWRISCARLDGSGPFSTFGGYDRTIMQLAGPSLRLSHGEHGEQRLEPFVPYGFPGEWSTYGELEGAGPAEDFNVMTRRGLASATVESLMLPAGTSCHRDTASVALVWAWGGACAVGVEGRTLALAGGEAALVEGGVQAPLVITGFGGRVILTVIHWAVSGSGR